jgi:hypothetical protein
VVLEREWRLSGHPFCCAGCVEVTALREPVCLVCREGGVGPGVSKISYHQRPHELRLAISSEAEARFPILAARPTLKLAAALEFAVTRVVAN